MKKTRYLLLMVVLLLLVGLACGVGDGVDEPEPTAAAEEAATETSEGVVDQAPTEAPSAESTVVPEPTQEPAPTGEAEPTVVTEPTKAPAGETLSLDPTIYTHPDGLFELYPPAGWTVETIDGGATFNAPDDSGFINVEVTNTSLTLDGESFERFVDAREANFFGPFEGYSVLSRQIDTSNGVANVTKELLFNGVPQIVSTLYDQHEQAIFSIDFWADEDVEPVYSPAYEEILDTASVESAAVASEVDVYYWIYDFSGPNDLFTIEVPVPWTYEYSESDTTIVDTFYSPDEHGIVQNLTYDDGQEISKSEAGAFGLELLKSYYAEDILITDDQVQPDGSERLTWNSPSGDFSGITFVETRGTTFLMFSILWDNPYEEHYFDVLDYTISTYDIPD